MTLMSGEKNVLIRDEYDIVSACSIGKRIATIDVVPVEVARRGFAQEVTQVGHQLHGVEATALQIVLVIQSSHDIVEVVSVLGGLANLEVQEQPE